MRTELFIAKRMGAGGGFAASLSRIAVATIALGVMVMVVAVAILQGFRREITDKVSGFGSHITIHSYQAVSMYVEQPLTLDDTLLAHLKATPGVRLVQPYATKGGMVKTADQIEGILFRGLPSTYDTVFYSSCLQQGHLPHFDTATKVSNEVLISTTLADKLRLQVGDKMRTYFWQDRNYRSRALTVCGTYRTDLAEVDNLYVLGDLRQVQRLNGWDSLQVGGIELMVDDFDRLDATALAVGSALPYDLTLTTVVSSNPSLFAWLDLLNSNITLIMAIMAVVCAIAVVSSLLIMIFEKRRTIGLLKTLGATNRSVRRVFLLRGGRLVLIGIAIGLAAGAALCLLQAHTGLLRLDPESYSMTTVPIALNPWLLPAIAAGTAAVCLVAMLLPASYIARLTPRETINR